MAHEDTHPLIDAEQSYADSDPEKYYEQGVISYAEARMGIPPTVSLAAKGNTALLHTVYKEEVGSQPATDAEIDPLSEESKRLAKKYGGHPDDYDWRAQ